MVRTRTGKFPIGLRRGGSDWQKNLADFIAFARANQFEYIDVGDLPPDQIQSILNARLKVGSVDLRAPWETLASSDSGKRAAAVAAAAEQIKSLTPLGVKNFFVVVFPEGEASDRKESFNLAVAGYSELARQVESTGARIVMEGYPGWYPHFAAHCCTPESLRAFFKAAPSPVLAINYDPSHLVRMGIDPVRFLKEFGSRVSHVHAKDTLFYEDGLYEFGNLQRATFAKPHLHGGNHWRYAIPGKGSVPWPAVLTQLKESGYTGPVSIELEDEDYGPSAQLEQRGILDSRNFLMNT
jgi:sugar phosphate isomerase/epimerase